MFQSGLKVKSQKSKEYLVVKLLALTCKCALSHGSRSINSHTVTADTSSRRQQVAPKAMLYNLIVLLYFSNCADVSCLLERLAIILQQQNIAA